MATNKVEFVISAKDEASQVIKNVDKNAQEMSWSVWKSFDSMVAPSAAFLWVITAVGAWMVVLAKNGLTAAADLETAEIGLTTLLKSADEAGRTVDRIKKEAARTPFELVGLSQAVQLLASVTKDGDKAIDVVLDVGEGLAAMGKWQPELDRIIVNLQQIAAVGKASMLDIKQFAFAGIPIFEMLQEQTWLYGEQLGDLITDGWVTFDMLTTMFDKANDEGWKFFNAYKNQAGSFNQALSNMKDSVTIFLSELVKQTWLFDAMKRVFMTVTDSLPKLMTVMQEFAQTLKENPNLVLWIVTAITAMLIPALYAAAAAALPFILAAGQLILISAAVGAAVYLLAEAWTNNFLGIQTATMAVFNAIKAIVEAFIPIFKGVWDMLAGYFQITFWSIIGIFKAFFQLLSGDSAWAWETIKQVYVNAWEWIIRFFGGLQAVVSGIFGLLWDAIKLGAELAWTAIIEVLKLAVTGLTMVIVGWVELIVTTFKAFWALLQWDWKGALNIMSGLWWGAFEKIKQIGITILTAIWEFIIGKVLDLVNWFTNDGQRSFTEWFYAMINGIGNVAKNVFNGVIGTIESFINYAINGLNQLIQASNKVNPLFQISTVSPIQIPRFAHGGLVGMSEGGVVSGAGWIDKVPAMLSAGEIVLNAAQQQNVGRQIQGGWTTVIVEVKNNNFYWDDENFAQKIWKTIMEDFKLHTAFPSFSS